MKMVNSDGSSDGSRLENLYIPLFFALKSGKISFAVIRGIICPDRNGEKTLEGKRMKTLRRWFLLLMVLCLCVGTAALAENGDAAAAETAVSEEALSAEAAAGESAGAEKPDMQFVLYLGTNDKDTNTPVFTEAEAMQRAKEILIRRFGGYTIQEAHGGWIGDDGKEYQEYTLVIYLSDTTMEEVHAAADEMIEVFRQSAILIHSNPTNTEFYSTVQ